jgi:hypothetical protein
MMVIPTPAASQWPPAQSMTGVLSAKRSVLILISLDADELVAIV